MRVGGGNPVCVLVRGSVSHAVHFATCLTSAGKLMLHTDPGLLFLSLENEVCPTDVKLQAVLLCSVLHLHCYAGRCCD